MCKCLVKTVSIDRIIEPILCSGVLVSLTLACECTGTFFELGWSIIDFSVNCGAINL